MKRKERRMEMTWISLIFSSIRLMSASNSSKERMALTTAGRERMNSMKMKMCDGERERAKIPLFFTCLALCANLKEIQIRKRNGKRKEAKRQRERKT